MMARLGATWRNGWATLACLATLVAVGGAAASCGGGGDDDAGDPKTKKDAGQEGSDSGHHPKDAASDAKTSKGAIALFSKPSTFVLTFPSVACGGAAETDTLTVTNEGSSVLAVSAAVTGSGFSVSPMVLQVQPGKTGTLTVGATAPSSSTAGTSLMGALNLGTNDPTQSSLTYQLSATPTGATLSILPEASFDFPGTHPGSASLPPLTRSLVNTGNAPATFTFGTPSDPTFSLSLGDQDGGQLAIKLDPGQMWQATAGFTPTSVNSFAATSSITTTGTTCGGSPTSVAFSGSGALGTLQGWPTTVDFGPSVCGGAAPASQTFTLTNMAPVDAHVISASITGPSGFTTSASSGQTIFAGGTATITVSAPPVVANSPTAPISATLSILTDADTSAHTIALTEEPSGAILAFDTTATPNFGSFGPIQLLGSATQSFNVKNTGTAQATVTVVAGIGAVPATDAGAPSSDAGDAASESGSPDAGDASLGAADATSEAAGGSLDATTTEASLDAAIASADANDAESSAGSLADGGDAESQAGAPSPFNVAPLTFTIPAGGTQAESVTFAPLAVSGATGHVAMISATGSVCGPLPAPLSLSGSGLGGGPTITSSSLPFLATCGGAAPAPQSFLVRNDGTTDLNWAMSAPTGAGASQYSVAAAPPPGLLIPGGFSTVTVTAKAVPSPAANPDPSAFAAQIAITTDVPLDPTHVVTFGETPLGDQLSFTTPGPLRFGQIPINTTLQQNFTLANNANAGSPAASVTFAVTGTGAAAYPVPSPATNLAPGATVSEKISFSPTTNVADPAMLGTVTTDALCTPLPTPLQLSGTGTKGVVSVSAATLAFGTDVNDPKGLVNCGATGLSQSFTVSNLGNQTFQITGLTLGKAAASPYTLSGSGTTLPATLAIGGSVTIAVAPAKIPPAVANPNDATAFSDTLTITTNAALDTPHAVALVMQPRGAVIASTPLATTWSFGTVSFGSIGTFTSSIQNTGNAGVSIALQGLTQPSIFGLQANPTMAAGNAVTSIIGQFTPSSSNGSWSDSGTLVITAQQVLCEPLPAAWNLPTISLSGASNSNPAVTVSGDLTFPPTDCGSAAPGGQAVLLSNAANVAYGYKAAFNSGKYYTISGATTGTVAANGTASVVVTPITVTPGPGVTPGSTPYADNLVITIATTPPTTWTLPSSWALNGAVLSLPLGAGPFTDGLGNLAYPADTTTGYTLPMVNTGTASATVNFGIAPLGAFLFSPAPPVDVIPGIGAAPGLSSSVSDAVCPAVTTSTATFFYSGPVCQPFSLPKVTVEACFGTFGPF